MTSLRTLPRRVFDGFGYATRAESPFARPRSVDALHELYQRASEERVPVLPRGAGRSYGDAATNRGGVILDLRAMRRLLSFDPRQGIAEVEPGFTVEDLWRHALPHRFWPRVVPGTMAPTLGGCAAMNIHGKNHHQAGGFGDAVEEVDLLTPGGEHLTLSRTENEAIFHAAISGFGMLGTFTRIKLRLTRVHSGRLRVRQAPARSLGEAFDVFSEHEGRCDYAVGWIDCFARGDALGRGQMHVAHYTREHEDPDTRWLEPDHQALPAAIFGVPRQAVGGLVRLFQLTGTMGLVNRLKYASSRFGSKRPYLQGHAAFHFLLDYVPTFREAYRPGGFIQYQPFVPAAHARSVFEEILRRSQQAGIVSTLGVMKRYRPDAFLLSHALDGYSLALDYPVTAGNRDRLWRLCSELSDLVLEAGGRFYPAKDSVLRPSDFARSLGAESLEQFARLRARCDPARIVRSDFSTRVGLEAG